MPNLSIFLDSSALMAGIISSQGASRTLPILSEEGRINLVVTEQVIVEVERNIAKKVPKALHLSREMILKAKLLIHRDPSVDELTDHRDWISHPADLPILVAAVKAQVNFFVTLNTHHFLDDPLVALRSGLTLATPGEVLKKIKPILE